MNWVDYTIGVGEGRRNYSTEYITIVIVCGPGFCDLALSQTPVLSPVHAAPTETPQLIRAFPLLITRWLVNRLLAVMVLPTPVRTTPCNGSALL